MNSITITPPGMPLEHQALNNIAAVPTKEWGHQLTSRWTLTRL